MSLIALEHVNPLDAPRRILFDLDTVSGVIRKKWWIVPLTMLVGLALMFLQESDLQTKPRYFTLTQSFEALDELAPLALVDLNPSLFQPIPSETSQLAVLRSDAYVEKALKNIDGDVDFRVDKSETRFALTTEGDVSEARRFSFSPATSSSYTFTCSEQDEINCSKVIKNYLQLLIELRADSIKAGLSRSLKLMDQLLVEPTKLTDIQRDKLVLQKTALQETIKIASGEMKLVGESKYFGGEQISTVNKSTYLFGLLVGFLIGCLILLQLTVSDNLLRTKKKLIGLIGYKNFLGSVDLKSEPNSIQHLASAVRGATEISNATTLRILPVGSNSENSNIGEELGRILGCKTVLANPISTLNANEIAPNLDSPIIIFAAKNQGRIPEIESTWTIAEKSGNLILGAVLVA